MYLDRNKYHIFVFFCLSIGIFSLSGGTQGPLVLDDFRNLAPLLGPEQPDYSNVIFSNESGPLGRSISMATFAVNHWVRGNINVSDLKLTNLLIHLINASLLYILLFTLLKGFDKKEQRCLVAFVITACWAFSPVNSSVIFYVIQRMTMLSTLFVLVACIVYLYMRPLSANDLQKNILAYSSLIILWILATLSKENGILLPFFIICMELCFFDDLYSWVKTIGRSKKRAFVTGFIIFPFILLMFISHMGYLDYDHVNYSLSDRLYTQPVILIDYVYRLVMPFNMDINLYFDDVPVLTTFWNQRTIICTLVIIVTVFMCLFSLLMKKFRCLSFGVLFFSIGHSVESTIFPLEMYFPHRNYLPSIGLYWALVLVVFKCFSYIGKSRLLFVIFGVYLSLFLFFSYQKSRVWSSNESIVTNAYHYHPFSIRANMTMVETMTRKGELQQALEINQKVIQNRSGDVFRPVIQRLYLYCRTDLTVPQYEYERFARSIGRFHALETSNALKNLLDIVNTRNCTGVDLSVIVNALAKWIDTQLDKKVHSPDQLWHLEYYVNEYLRVSKQDEFAVQRLQRFMGLGSIAALTYYNSNFERTR